MFFFYYHNIFLPKSQIFIHSLFKNSAKQGKKSSVILLRILSLQAVADRGSPQTRIPVAGSQFSLFIIHHGQVLPYIHTKSLGGLIVSFLIFLETTSFGICPVKNILTFFLQNNIDYRNTCQESVCKNSLVLNVSYAIFCFKLSLSCFHSSRQKQCE